MLKAAYNKNACINSKQNLKWQIKQHWFAYCATYMYVVVPGAQNSKFSTTPINTYQLHCFKYYCPLSTLL